MNRHGPVVIHREHPPGDRRGSDHGRATEQEAQRQRCEQTETGGQSSEPAEPEKREAGGDRAHGQEVESLGGGLVARIPANVDMAIRPDVRDPGQPEDELDDEYPAPEGGAGKEECGHRGTYEYRQTGVSARVGASEKTRPRRRPAGSSDNRSTRR
jgi:hypothetical protein